ncbi:NUDIX domain-containing protein [Candidatus Margulisiibacteriota bacterium]
MSGLEEKKIKSERKFKGRLLGLRVDTVKTPGGNQATREVVEHPGAVAVVALTKDKEMVLVRQFRQPTGQVLVELPAGVPKKSESAEDCARRELEEETGFHAKKVKKVWAGYASPGYSDELIQFCLAEDMTRMKQNTEEDEFIEVDLVDLDACVDMLKNGKINDNKTMIGITIADKHLKGELS